jgi:hypothetical protein
VTALVTAGAGFLLAVLWFDLMFDVQVLRHRVGELPEEVLASIAAYYRRVTTEAGPMNRLVAVVMVVTLGAIVVQIANDDVPRGAAWASLVLAGLPIGIAVARTFPAAVRLGARPDAAQVQSRLARSICRDHLLCLTGIAALIAVQLSFAA